MLNRPFTGVIAAPLLPMHEGGAIDWATLERYIDWIAAQRPAGIAMNMDASEVIALEDDEQMRVIEVCRAVIAARVPLLSGVVGGSTQAAARKAVRLRDAGAEGFAVFPPFPTFSGAPVPEAMIVRYHRAIADAAGLPIICFQYPLVSGLGYPVDTLLRLIEAVPSIRAIKDWCNNVMQHERQIRILQSLPRPVNVLSTHSAWLYSSLVLGCNGLLSGSGSVIADLQVALFEAVKADDMKRARQINDSIYPIAQAFYADPFVDMHNRMKEALVLLGRIPCAAVRPPLVKISNAEIALIRQALNDARVLREGALAA